MKTDGLFAALVWSPAAKPPVSHSCDTIAVFALFLWSQHRWAGQLGGAELYLRIPHRCRPQPKLSEVISENCILSLSRPDAAPILHSSECDKAQDPSSSQHSSIKSSNTARYASTSHFIWVLPFLPETIDRKVRYLLLNGLGIVEIIIITINNQ